MERTGFVVWLTGLSGSGKTTIAIMLELELRHRGVSFIQRLDGDIVRSGICRDLGFTKEDRDENIRRVGYIAGLLSTNGVVTLVSFISPYREARDTARQCCRTFVEVYVKCNLDTLVQRDVKGLYRKALDGEIPHFTGVSDPYEEPLHPELIIETARQTPEESVRDIIAYLEGRELIG
ncbi:MAG: adenylyl-sulfate kinase [Methanoregula sp.]